MQINFHRVALIQKIKIFAIIHIFSAQVIENVLSAFHNSGSIFTHSKAIKLQASLPILTH